MDNQSISMASQQAATIIDSDHPAVAKLAAEVTADIESQREKAIALYYAVRDGYRYDPYAIDLSDAGLSASRVLEKGHGWCVTKSALLAAVCRAAGVPARVGYANVKNHLSTARMRELLKTDVFYWHGYTSIFLEGKWVKATPAFNVELCRKFKLHELDFDGLHDSIYHPFDLTGQRHMEYLDMLGEFDEVPGYRIREDFDRYYPELVKLSKASFDRDAEQEVKS